jgi:hypothetical protein
VRLDHRNVHVGVAQQPLHGLKVVASKEQMAGEGVATCISPVVFGLAGRRAPSPLKAKLKRRRPCFGGKTLHGRLIGNDARFQGVC